MSAYTYLIGWTAHDKWYYGYRGANKSSPEEDLWVRYFTSSKYVEEFRKLHGEPDVVKVHRIFESCEEARLHEHRVLSKLKAVGSVRWLNRTNGGGRDFFDGSCRTPETYRKISKALKGRVFRSGYKLSEETKAKIGAKSKGRTASAETRKMWSEQRTGVKPWNKGVPFSEDSKAKMAKAARAQAHVCPHCGKTGGNVLFRWHFDNCKQKDTKC